MFNVLIGFALGWSAARIISGQPLIPPGLGQRVEQTVNQLPMPNLQGTRRGS